MVIVGMELILYVPPVKSRSPPTSILELLGEMVPAQVKLFDMVKLVPPEIVILAPDIMVNELIVVSEEGVWG